MSKELNCQQIISLLNFYLNNKLNPKLCSMINQHLETCPSCKKKYIELLKIFNKSIYYQKNLQNKNETTFKMQHINKLSPYVDNELNFEDNVKIKKLAIANISARKELEEILKYKKILKLSYLKTKADVKTDYSKKVLNALQIQDIYSTNYFYKLSIIFFLILSTIVVGFLYLYF